MWTPVRTYKRVLMVGANHCGTTTFCMRLQEKLTNHMNLPMVANPFVFSQTFGELRFDFAVHDSTLEELFLFVNVLAFFDIILFCFALNDDRSFESVKGLYHSLQSTCIPSNRYFVGMKADLCGNKSLPWFVSRDEAKLFSNTYCLRNYMECSSLFRTTYQPENVMASIALDVCNVPLSPQAKCDFEKKVCRLE